MMNSSGPMYNSPVVGSVSALLVKRSFVWAETWLCSSEPTRLSLTTPVTAAILDMFDGWGQKSNKRQVKSRKRGEGFSEGDCEAN